MSSSDNKETATATTITHQTKVNRSSTAPVLERRLPANTASSNDDNTKKKGGKNAVQGVTAASARAVTTQVLGFYFRYPVKAFFRQRIDYLQVARAINPRVQANEAWSLRTSTLGLLTHAVREKGWRFIPQQVLPPMFANAGIGALLYTSYLQILQRNYNAATQERIYPPPPLAATFNAGSMAGGIQSLVGAPLEALRIRFDVRDMLEKKYSSMNNYAHHKLKEIGVRGVFSGFLLSLSKDSLGYGLFFCSFEYVKQQMYYNFLSRYYGSQRHPYRRLYSSTDELPLIRPHWALEPSFLLLAGATASFTSSSVFHPLTRVQGIHYSRLETIDYAKSTIPGFQVPKHIKGIGGILGDIQSGWVFKNVVAYHETFKQCQTLARVKGGWRRWLYKGFWGNTIKNTPSTAAALIVFELMRRKFGDESGEMSIVHDGFRVLL